MQTSGGALMNQLGYSLCYDNEGMPKVSLVDHCHHFHEYYKTLITVCTITGHLLGNSNWFLRTQ